MIPLDVGDVVFAKQRIYLTEHVSKRSVVGKIKHLLISKGRRNSTARLQNPVWMLAIKVAVGVDHLALEPEPKLHAVGFDGVNQRLQPIWPNIGTDSPIAKTRAVISARAEPTVVENESFDTNFTRDTCQLGEFG